MFGAAPFWGNERPSALYCCFWVSLWVSETPPLGFAYCSQVSWLGRHLLIRAGRKKTDNRLTVKNGISHTKVTHSTYICQSRLRKVWENTERPTLHHEQTLKDKKVASYFLLTFFQDKEGKKEDNDRISLTDLFSRKVRGKRKPHFS